MSKTITSFDPLPTAPQPAPARQPRRARPAGPQSRYDGAAAGETNAHHWLAADSLGPNQANSPEVRARLRTRSRYETANNGYAKGLVVGRANDTVGTGPRLQLVLPERWADAVMLDAVLDTPPDVARAVEQRWQEWGDAVGLTDDLHVMDRGDTREGESFAVMITNGTLPAGTPQLDLKLFEADECATPDIDALDPFAVDGMRLDAAGNVVEYHFLKAHPGDSNWWGFAFAEYERVPARFVIHLFDRDRARQARGVPALTPGIALFNQLRRYTLATLDSAEIAASIAGVIEDENMADPLADDAELFTAMDKVPIPRGSLITLPSGKRAKQFPAEQPTQSFRDFRGDILTESGRGIGAPRNVSTGSSAEYNYSSGRLDHLPYQQSIKIRRDKIRRVVLNPLFRTWLAEAALIPGYLPADLPPVELWRWQWRWDGFASIDPLKDATANQVKHEAGHTTLDNICASEGLDWEEVLEQQAREMDLRKKLGLVPPAAPQKSADTAPADAGEAADG